MKLYCVVCLKDMKLIVTGPTAPGVVESVYVCENTDHEIIVTTEA